jgi:DNA-binding transcriptional ArsR family regulator
MVARELGALLKVLSHPDRILIVHALATTGECSVTGIAERLRLPTSRVSQHLSLLRAFRLVSESSEGRKRIYTLAVSDLPQWLLEGVDFVADRIGEVSRDQAEDAKRLWIEGSELPPGSN